ncbi:MAG TPA: CDP-alcohol phosphatidyltransferase family protein [Polyangiaceae bacterium]|nr:CDP-alcohol phosphatidyltransferase family protein [Polyangiaceae bacterium]
MTDLLCSVGLLIGVVMVAIAYAGGASGGGDARHSRVENDGGSPWLTKRAMDRGYRALLPLARGCVALGIGASVVSFASLAFAAAAGLALALGHYGVGAALGVASSACDALDGCVARETGTASDAGEVLDATIDRYAELLFLAGIAIEQRASAVVLGVVLTAIAGSVMVSYATAKAEAMRVEGPRGSMRRVERAVYLGTGAALVPMAALLAERWHLPGWAARAPILAALLLVALVANASAVWRLRAVARVLRARAGGVVLDANDAHGLSRERHVGAGNAAE